MTTRDHCIALRQARTAYWMARRRLSRLNGEGSASKSKRGQALQDVTRARRNLERQAHYTHGWLAGRKSVRRYERAGIEVVEVRHD